MSSDSQRSRKLQPVIIKDSRESSTHSRNSDSSQSPSEGSHSSSRSSSMANGHRQNIRVPDKLDNDSHMIQSKSYKSGNRTVEVIHQHAPRYDKSEPRTSEATSGDYEKTRKRKNRR